MAGRAPVQNLILSLRAELARVAFAAALVGKEVRQPLQHVAHVRALVEDHDHARAERQAGRAQVLEGQHHVQMFLGGKGARGAAKQHRLKRAPGMQPAREINSKWRKVMPNGTS